MKPYLLWIAVAATVAVANEDFDLRPKLNEAGTAVGTDYLRMRDNIILETTTNALWKAAEDSQLDWRDRLVARIALERKLRGADIEAMRSYDWYSDPAFIPQWMHRVTGPAHDMGPLAKQRFEQAGLWYYYIEYSWKDTGEGFSGEGVVNQRDGRVRSAWWAYAAGGLLHQPEYLYFRKIVLDVLQMSLHFHERNIGAYYRLLLRDNCSDAVPALVERFEQFLRSEYSVLGSKPIDSDLTWDQIASVRYQLKRIIAISDQRHVDLVSKHIDANSVFGPLRQELEAVRQRPAPEPTPEPPFRVMPTPEFLKNPPPRRGPAEDRWPSLSEQDKWPPESNPPPESEKAE